MVHIPTRGDVPVRLGPGVQTLPDYGPSTMDADVVHSIPCASSSNASACCARTGSSPGAPSSSPTPATGSPSRATARPSSSPASPTASLAAFHNVCQHRGPAIVGELGGLRRPPLHLPVPRLGLRHDGQARRRARARGLRRRAPRRRARAGGGRRRVGRLGVDQPGRPGQGAAAARRRSARRSSPTSAGSSMEDMVLHEVVEWDVPVSYKAIVDGFNEIYHATQLHQRPPEWVTSGP